MKKQLVVTTIIITLVAMVFAGCTGEEEGEEDIEFVHYSFNLKTITNLTEYKLIVPIPVNSRNGSIFPELIDNLKDENNLCHFSVNKTDKERFFSS